MTDAAGGALRVPIQIHERHDQRQQQHVAQQHPIRPRSPHPRAELLHQHRVVPGQLAEQVTSPTPAAGCSRGRVETRDVLPVPSCGRAAVLRFVFSLPITRLSLLLPPASPS